MTIINARKRLAAWLDSLPVPVATTLIIWGGFLWAVITLSPIILALFGISYVLELTTR